MSPRTGMGFGVPPWDPSYVGLPSTPSGFSVSSGDGQNTVSWTSSEQVEVYRSTITGFPLGDSTLVHTASAGDSSWTDTGLSNATQYFYRVVAVNTAGRSDPTSEVSGTPQAAGASADVVEDFSTYTSKSDFLNDPRDIYDPAQIPNPENTGDMALDGSISVSGSGQSLKYTFPSGTATDYTISRTFDLPGINGSNPTEVWARVNLRFTSDFDLTGNGQDAASAYKLLHHQVNTSLVGRFGLNFIFTDITAEMPGQGDTGFFEWNESNSIYTQLFDEQWHTIRYHTRAGNEFHEFWWDGNYAGSASASLDVTDFWGVSIGRNLNKLSDHEMSLWWGKVELWFDDNDPGWSAS